MMMYRSDEGWRPFTRQQLEDLGIYPNRVQYNARLGKADLICTGHPDTPSTRWGKMA
jgi:hypothetical protein